MPHQRRTDTQNTSTAIIINNYRNQPHLKSYNRFKVLVSKVTPESVLFHEQTLGSGIEVSQPPVQKYGTVCRMHSDNLAQALLCLNNILNPTRLM